MLTESKCARPYEAAGSSVEDESPSASWNVLQPHARPLAVLRDKLHPGGFQRHFKRVDQAIGDRTASLKISDR
jgi:hypothetical protein